MNLLSILVLSVAHMPYTGMVRAYEVDPQQVNLIHVEWPPTSVAELVDGSDLIARGTLANPRVKRDGERLYTEFDFVPSRVLFQRNSQTFARPAIVPNVSVRFLGGSGHVDGREIRTVSPEFPVPQAGSDVLLFLRQLKGRNHWLIIRGPYGFFTLLDGRLHPLPEAAESHRHHRGVEFSVFARELATYLPKK